MTSRVALQIGHLAFWYVFLFGTSGGTHFLLEDSYRYFWAVGYLYALGFLALYPRLIVDLIWRNKLLFVWPVLAVLSTFWSIAPSISLQHGIQLTMTILIGLIAVQTLGFPRLIRIVFFVLLGSALLSVLAVLGGVDTAIGSPGEWQGIYSHKNVLGSNMVVLGFTAGILFFTPKMRAVSLFAILIAAFLVYQCKSGTSLLCFALAMTILGAVVMSRRLPAELSVPLGLVTLATIGIVAVLAASDVFADILELLGKDVTLTGRTVLWDYAYQTIDDNFALGVGFNAFWYSDLGEHLRYIMQHPRIASFHNNYLEVSVSLGVTGLVAYLGILLIVLFRAIQRIFVRPDIWSLWTLIFVSYVLFFGLAESVIFFSHTFKQMLFASAAALTVPLSFRTESLDYRSGSETSFRHEQQRSALF